MVIVGATLITGSHDGTVRRWSLREKDLTSSAGENKADTLPGSGAQPSTTAEGSSPVKGLQAEVPEKDSPPSMMTEEEERELAELMGSDDDDD